jgi:hypothetical protein
VSSATKSEIRTSLRKGRASKGAAYALLAKVILPKKWQKDHQCC